VVVQTLDGAIGALVADAPAVGGAVQAQVESLGSRRADAE
jgi:hypothetical protein